MCLNDEMNEIENTFEMILHPATFPIWVLVKDQNLPGTSMFGHVRIKHTN
jgi:hypothetical protein